MRSHKAQQVQSKHMPRTRAELAAKLAGGGVIAESLKQGEIPAADVDQRRANDGKVLGNATELNPEDGEVPPEVKRMVVMENASVVAGGASTRLARGKVVDSLNYDLRRLVQQGVRMKELKDGQDPFDVLAPQQQ